MTMELTQLNDGAAISWKSPAMGLWVATTVDSYLGMVERRDGRYVATNASGTELGTFDEIAEAQIAIDLDDLGTASHDLRDVAMMKATLAMTGISGIGLIVGLFLIAR